MLSFLQNLCRWIGRGGFENFLSVRSRFRAVWDVVRVSAIFLMIPCGMTWAAETPGVLVGWGNNSLGQISIPSGLGKVVAISAGASHSLAVLPDGSVAAWGNNVTVPSGLPGMTAVAAGFNFSMALSTNGFVYVWGDDPINTPPLGLSNVVAIAAGSTHCLALRADGTVIGWGANDRFQASVPSGLRNVRAIAAGDGHSLALRTDGSVIGWGDNSLKQATPVGLSGRMIAIAAGDNHSLALREDGKLFTWGDNTYGQRSVPSGLPVVTAIAAGGNCTMVSFQNRSLYAWGDSTFGQLTLPFGFTNAFHFSCGRFHCLATRVDPPGITTQPTDASVLAGVDVTFSVTATGSPPLNYQWRINGTNLVGATSATLTLNDVTATNAGTYTVLISNSAGSVVSGNAKLAIRIPPAILEQPNDATVAVGASITLQVQATGPSLLYQWRKDGKALKNQVSTFLSLNALQLTNSGNYDVVITNTFGAVTSAVAHVVVKALPAVTQPPVGFQAYPGTAGRLRVVATDTDRYQWLRNGSPVANGTDAVLILNPITANEAGGYSVQVMNDFGTNASGIVQVTLAPVGDFSEVVGWGESEVWNGERFVSILPPTGLVGIQQVATGADHGLVLRTNGVIVAWGDTSRGAVFVPTDVGPAVSVAAGDGFSVALRTDGKVVGWGAEGSVVSMQVPAAATNVTAIAAGTSHVLALRKNGSLVAWGSNQAGESSIPNGVAPVIAIAAGDGFNLVIQAGGSVLGWGRNDRGQTRPPQSLRAAVGVAAGRAHALALDGSGNVVAWGDNQFGQTSVPSFPAPVIAIAAGADHSMALLANNQVVVWGKDNFGQLDVPRDLNSVRAIDGFGDHCAVVRSRGLVVLPLQFAPGGLLRVTVASGDGSAIDAVRAARIQAYATDDLSLPTSAWTNLGHGSVVDGGALRFLETVTDGHRNRFYKVIEN